MAYTVRIEVHFYAIRCIFMMHVELISQLIHKLGFSCDINNSIGVLSDSEYVQRT